MKGNLTNESRAITELALGRIFRLLSRPYQPGDIEQYEKCRKVVMELADTDGEELQRPPLPGWNFGRGAEGVIE